MRYRVWRKAFLTALADPCNVGNIQMCAEKAGRERTAVYRLRKADATFAAEWDAALKICEIELDKLIRKSA